MLSLDDRRWQTLAGGYRVPFDPRLQLSKLAANNDTKAAWQALWEELHHQGDVGEASYAAVPHLVRIYRQRGVVDWNTYAIVAVIELARDSGKNPEVPEWLKEDYLQAIRDLAEAGAAEVLKAKNSEDIRAILSILAIAAGARTHAKFLINYSAEELLEMERLVSEVGP
jgi:predicted house-cleaning noncanonical NTP pyrophosphatase (MazG superfamily)